LTRTLERTAIAVAALLLQLFFILLFAHFLLTPHAQRERAREMLLLLRPLTRPLPPPPPAPARPAPARQPTQPVPYVLPPLPNAAPNLVAPGPPSALEGIGRALYGCTPEAMALLSPQDRAKCPALAERPPPAQEWVEPRSHAKDEAMWAEQKAERDWMPECVGAEVVAKCMMHQGMAEQQRAQQAWAKITEDRQRRAQPPPRPLPKIVGPR
jgi:hypothetical protein